MEITAICHGMTRSEIVDATRLAFQQRCTDGSWTISPEEAEEILGLGSVPTILLSMSNVGRFLKRERQERLMFYSEEECIQLLHKEIGKVGNKNASTKRATRRQ